MDSGTRTGVGSLSVASESSVGVCTVKRDRIELWIIFSFFFFVDLDVSDVLVLVDFFFAFFFGRPRLFRLRVTLKCRLMEFLFCGVVMVPGFLLLMHISIWFLHMNTLLNGDLAKKLSSRSI